MAGDDWQGGYFESSRGRVVAQLRCGSHTVEELARTLGVTPNAVRLHLQALERDGLVRLAGTRRTDTAGKPAHVYEIVRGADARFSRAYAPMLRAVLDAMTARLPAATVDAIARDAGRAVAARFRPPAEGLPADPVERVSRFLADLGGQATVERRRGMAVVRGCGCVLGAVTGDHAVMCRAVGAVLSAVAGVRVREECERGESPSCRFTIALPAA